MSELVAPLIRLAIRQGADFGLRVTPNKGVRVTFKLQGQRARCIEDPFASDAMPACAEMLRRLAMFEDLYPDTERDPHAAFIASLNASQRERLTGILKMLRDFKQEVLHPEQDEPVLASPRSSLNPDFLDGERDRG